MEASVGIISIFGGRSGNVSFSIKPGIFVTWYILWLLELVNNTFITVINRLSFNKDLSFSTSMILN